MNPQILAKQLLKICSKIDEYKQRRKRYAHCMCIRYEDFFQDPSEGNKYLFENCINMMERLNTKIVKLEQQFERITGQKFEEK